MRSLLLGIFVTLSLLGCMKDVWGQTIDKKHPIIVGAANNETTKANLDLLAESAGTDKLIILISRLGKSESSRSLGWLRMRTAQDYLRSTRALPKERVVLAEGERTNREGRIEVYLDNKLFMIFVFDRNQNYAREQ